MSELLGFYDDHAASQSSDQLEYITLCDACAEDRAGDVTYLSPIVAGHGTYCEDCGGPDMDEEED